ncbi:MAG: hypothetical protein RJA12_837, partial [Planctomycetota bacterium]
MRNRSRIAALFATLLACVATGAARAQTTIADFTGNALPTGWTAANTNTNVLTLAPSQVVFTPDRVKVNFTVAGKSRSFTLPTVRVEVAG